MGDSVNANVKYEYKCGGCGKELTVFSDEGPTAAMGVASQAYGWWFSFATDEPACSMACASKRGAALMAEAAKPSE